MLQDELVFLFEMFLCVGRRGTGGRAIAWPREGVSGGRDGHVALVVVVKERESTL